MHINNYSVWICWLVQLTTFWLAHTYYRRDWMAIVILFYLNYCKMLRLLFVNACGFGMMGRQPTSVLAWARTRMLRLRLEQFGVVDQSLIEPDIPIYHLLITFYRDIWRILFMRLHLMGILLLAYQKLLRVYVIYLGLFNVYFNHTSDAMNHVSLFMVVILNNHCKHCTCQRRFQ